MRNPTQPNYSAKYARHLRNQTTDTNTNEKRVEESQIENENVSAAPKQQENGIKVGAVDANNGLLDDEHEPLARYTYRRDWGTGVKSPAAGQKFPWWMNPKQTAGNKISLERDGMTKANQSRVRVPVLNQAAVNQGAANQTAMGKATSNQSTTTHPVTYQNVPDQLATNKSAVSPTTEKQTTTNQTPPNQNTTTAPQAALSWYLYSVKNPDPLDSQWLG